MNIYKKYEDLMAKKAALEAEILEAQKAIYLRNKNEYDLKQEGTISHTEDGYKVSVVKRMITTVDQDYADKNPGLFAVKYTWNKKHFETLTPVFQEMAKKGLTKKPGKPSFKVVPV